MAASRSGSPPKSASPSRRAASPKKKRARRPKKAATHPPVQAMILAALKASKDRKGTSLAAIKKHMAANNRVDMARLAPHIKMSLKRGVASGVLKQASGTGASGRFRVGRLPKAPGKKKAKKPKKKRARKAKKVKKAKKPKAKKAAKKRKPKAKKAKKPKAAKKTARKAKAKGQEGGKAKEGQEVGKKSG